MKNNNEHVLNALCRMLKGLALYGLGRRSAVKSMSSPSKGQLKKRKAELRSGWVAALLDSDQVWSDQMSLLAGDPELRPSLPPLGEKSSKESKARSRAFEATRMALLEDRVAYYTKLTKRRNNNEDTNSTRVSDNIRVWRSESGKSC